MSKKKQRLTIYDVGRLPLSDVKVKRDAGVGHLHEFRRAEEQRERETAAAREAEIQRVQTDTSRLMAECLAVSAPQMAKFWSQPLDKIKNRIDANFDNLFLPTGDAAINRDATYDAIQKFLDGVVFEQGYSLGDISRRRFSMYVASQVNAGVIVDSASLAVMFDRCFALGIFKGDDAEFNEHFKVKKEAKQPRVEQEAEQPRRATLADLEAVDAEGRGGLQEAARIADELYFDERQPMVRAWFDSLLKSFGIVISHADASRCKQWFERNNKSFLVPANFNSCRRWMVASGFWPEGCLTETEKFNLSLEKIDMTRLTVHERNDLNRREQAARAADIAKYGHA